MVRDGVLGLIGKCFDEDVSCDEAVKGGCDDA